MRRSAEFARTISRGHRASGRFLVVHARLDDDPTPAQAARVGFVVSKSVGGAVRRNTVKRRLRAVVGQFVGELPAQLCLVVRAKPAANDAGFAQLQDEATQLVRRCRSVLARSDAA